MSRIGKLPIVIPAGVTITKDENNVVTVKGPKGQLSERIHRDIVVAIEAAAVLVQRKSDQNLHRGLHGLSRTLIANMVEGVTNGFQKRLVISGVGYRAQKQGKKLVIAVGYSHPVEIEEADGIEFEVPEVTKIVVKGISKQKVGAVAANIRDVRRPEPYKGKGIMYEGEKILRKVGKTGK